MSRLMRHRHCYADAATAQPRQMRVDLPRAEVGDLRPMPDLARLRLMQSRRRWLKQAGVLASSTALPLWIPGSSAQSDSPLSTLPRTALVIGNTRYSHAPLRRGTTATSALA